MSLFNLAKLLYYFNQHYQQLFVARKFYLKNFEKIEVHFSKVCVDQWSGLIRHISNDGFSFIDYGEMSTMFDQTSNEQYPIDKEVIEIIDIKQGIESFSSIYQNIVAWLKERQMQYGRGYYHDAIKNCKVVFVLQAYACVVLLHRHSKFGTQLKNSACVTLSFTSQSLTQCYVLSSKNYT